MIDIETIRGGITEKQQKILDATWTYFLSNRQWPHARLTHQQFDGKPVVRSVLEELGGSVIYEYEDGRTKKYRFTFLGILLSKDGLAYEALLVRFLAFASQLCLDEPIRTHVSSQEAANELGLDYSDTSILGYLIQEGHFYRGGNFSYKEWNVEICEMVEDFPKDLQAYVRDQALTDFNPDMPIDSADRASYWSRIRAAASGLPATASVPIDQQAVAYVDQTRIEELRSLYSDRFDLTKLIAICNELNISYSNECYLTVAILTRALIDHIPPIFEAKIFSEVAANYQGPHSFKESMKHLDKSLRKIADSHLHVHIRRKEVMPNRTQVNFANDIDVLLAEVVRILS